MMKTYMARQPIFDASMNVFGYELLYRSSTQNAFDESIDGDYATRQVLSDTLTTFGTENILNGKRAFINFTRSLLLSELPDLMNPSDFVIEILENVPADAQVMDRLIALRVRGFTLALDDYIGAPESEALLPLVDIVKVDFKGISATSREKLVQKLLKKKLQVLAEKVETQNDFVTAKKMGYTLFQGYFFAKPIVFSKTVLSTSSTTYIRAIDEILHHDADFTKISAIIRSDVTLTYRLLRHVNTLQFCHSNPITSVKPAILQMGERATYRWLMLVLMRDMTQLSNNEFSKLALVRALFCEQICKLAKLPYQQDEAYIAGMFSVIDTMVSQDYAEFLRDISIAPVVIDALLHNENKLSEILEFVRAYESGDWDSAHVLIDQYALSDDAIIKAYQEAVQAADHMF